MIHSFVNAQADGADATVTRPSNWNAKHVSGQTQVSANYSVALTDDFIEVTGGVTDITVILPAVATVPAGGSFEFIRMDASVGNVIIDANGTETINGQLAWPLKNQWQYLKVTKNKAGTGWNGVGA